MLSEKQAGLATISESCEFIINMKSWKDEKEWKRSGILINMVSIQDKND